MVRMKERKILFVCKFNQTRSQIAQALFNKLNQKSFVKAYSAGVIKPEISRDLNKNLRKLFKKYSLKYGKPKQLSKKFLNKQEMIIVVADDVPLLLFNSQKKNGISIVKWKVKDGWKYLQKTRFERLEQVYFDIEKRIKKLNINK
tara:strand:+ start:1483 stop:1917 length:435 start_codon:yes stop_codon:yes gene_type:complete